MRVWDIIIMIYHMLVIEKILGTSNGRLGFLAKKGGSGHEGRKSELNIKIVCEELLDERPFIDRGYLRNQKCKGGRET